MKVNRVYLSIAAFCILTLGYQNCGNKMGFSPNSSAVPQGALVTKSSTTSQPSAAGQTSAGSQPGSSNNGTGTATGTLPPAPSGAGIAKISCQELDTEAENSDKGCRANAKGDPAKERDCDAISDLLDEKTEEACENDDQDKDESFGVLCIIKAVKDTDTKSGKEIEIDQDEKLAFLETGKTTPHSICMSPKTCLVTLNDHLNAANGILGAKPSMGGSSSSQIQFTRFQENGVCRHNKHVKHFSDDQIKAILPK